MTIDKEIRKMALKNAIDYKGKANPKAIVGRILGSHAEWREKRKELMEKVDQIVGDVNNMSVEAQQSELEELAPEMLEKKEKKERNIFAFLGIKEGDKVVTAFPPGPEKYSHVGHAKAALLNYLLAEKYGGKFLLRFEDTNPKLVKSIFYDVIPENLSWLGIKWENLIYASDYMDLFYSMCDKAFDNGDAYVCTCDMEAVRLSREKGIACSCRDRDSEENKEMFESMKKDTPEGHAIVRLKIDLEHKNSTMRDPTIFRIIDQEHARQGKKYRVWPNYDWQNAIMDSHTGVTHRIRSKEFELRNELQRHIQDKLGLRRSSTYEIGRFKLTGVETSGRAIREGIEQGKYLGWDDPALATIVALRRRGFLPKAIENFVVSTGLSKADATLTWDDMFIHNKRLLDESADRYFFVANPVDLYVTGAGEDKVVLNLHPTHRKGGRIFETHDNFVVAKKDFDTFHMGEMYRLMDCLNFRVQENGYEFVDREVETFKKHGNKIVHWLPKSDSLIKAEIMMPDKSIVDGLCEATVANVNVGDVIQFERFGFCRLDAKNPDGYVFVFSHK